MNIYTLLATLGGLFVAYGVASVICQTIVVRSFHRMQQAIYTHGSDMFEIAYDGDPSRFGGNNDDDGGGFLN